MSVNYELEKYINKIGKWWLKDKPEEIFCAQLVYKNGKYILESDTLNINLYKAVLKHDNNKFSNFCIYGNIKGVLFSLISCFTSATKTNMNPFAPMTDFEMESCYYGAEILPSEIVFGDFYANNNTEIVSAIVDFNKIDEFIRIPTYETHETGLKYTITRNITLQLDSFSINFFAMLLNQTSRNSQTYTSNIHTEFLFQNKSAINIVRTQIAKFRMLLSLLKLNYINISSVEISNDFTDKITIANKAFYHMNHSVDEILEDWDNPFFCLEYDTIADIFNDIVKKWYVMFEEAEPVFELFYQILIKKSFDINKFLNLTQAVEVYSNKYRINEVKSLIAEFPNSDGSKKVRLFHKIYDLFFMVKDCFGLDDKQIEKISHLISNTRNYFTHYGSNSKKKALVNFRDRLPISDLMTYLLTILIYLELGIPANIIKDNFFNSNYEWTLQHIKESYK